MIVNMLEHKIVFRSLITSSQGYIYQHVNKWIRTFYVLPNLLETQSNQILYCENASSKAHGSGAETPQGYLMPTSDRILRSWEILVGFPYGDCQFILVILCNPSGSLRQSDFLHDLTERILSLSWGAGVSRVSQCSCFI